MTPEGRVKLAVKRELVARDIWYYMPVQNGLGQVGIPDFVCCWRGRFLAIETKAPGKLGNVTPNQRRVLDELKLHGAATVVVDNVNDLISFLEAIDE